MKVKKFYEPVFKVTLLFIVGCSVNELKKYSDKKKIIIHEIEKMAGFTCILEPIETKSKDGGIFTEHIMWIENKKNFYDLLHESLHLVGQIFNERGIPIRKENDEMMAIYQEWWFKTLWRFMNKK